MKTNNTTNSDEISREKKQEEFGGQKGPEQGRQKSSAQGIDQAYQQGSDHRSAYRTDAADDDHHKSKDQNRLPHAGLDCEDRSGHHPGKTGEQSTQTEYKRIEKLDIDPEC